MGVKITPASWSKIFQKELLLLSKRSTFIGVKVTPRLHGVKYSRGSYCYSERRVKINPRKLLQFYSKNDFTDQILHDLNRMLGKLSMGLCLQYFFVPEHDMLAPAFPLRIG